jgi:dTDP-4-dehydrorhamnose 3,5-epimerase
MECFSDHRGSVKRIMSAAEAGFAGFGEVYASSIKPGAVKGWHLHERARRDYVVLSGTIRLVLYDGRSGSASGGLLQEIVLGDENYVRVTIPPQVWSSFACVGAREALVVDVTDRPHNPAEVRRADPFGTEIPYRWELPANQP